MGVSVTLLASQLYYMVENGGSRCFKTISPVYALEAITRQGIKFDKKSPINTVSQHTKIFKSAFVNAKRSADVLAARKLLME